MRIKTLGGKIALGFLVAIGIIIVVVPLFLGEYSDSATDMARRNLPPNISLMKVPKELDGKILQISCGGNYGMGLSEEGRLFFWGILDGDFDTSGIEEKIVKISAGYDHAVAIGESGKIYCFGKDNLSQFAKGDILTYGVNPREVKKIVCGNQYSVILMDNGQVISWGNENACYNCEDVFGEYLDVDLGNNYFVGIEKDGRIFPRWIGEDVVDEDGNSLRGLRAKSLATTANGACFLFENGQIGFWGESYRLPELQEDEKIVKLFSGEKHYAIETDRGRCFTFGENRYGQCFDGAKTGNVFVGSVFTYVVFDRKLTFSCGLKGFVFGTDNFGADVFKRTLSAGKRTVGIGLIAVAISSVIGIATGLVSGTVGGKVDTLLMRICEVFASIPFLPFAMILSSLLAQSNVGEGMRIFMIMLILGLLTWPSMARLIRAQVVNARSSEYVLSARALGMSETKIAFTHLLPNVAGTIVVSLTLDLAGCMLTESALSYLGFGITFPTPTWGNMLANTRNLSVIRNYPWQWLAPSAFLAGTSICVNALGNSLEVK